MNYLKTLVFLCAALFGATSFAQSSPQTFSRIRDGALPNNLANVYQFQITFPSTYYGLFTASGTYYYDGDSATFRRWWGKTAGADNITNSTPFPWVGGFNYAFDGTTWDRVRYTAAGDTLGSTPAGVNSLSLNTFYDGTNFRRWTGEAWDADMENAPVQASVNSFGVFYDGTGGRYWNGTTMADNLSNPVAPFVGGLTLFYDGTNYRRWTGESWDGNMDTSAPKANTNAFGVFYNGSAGSYWHGATLSDAMAAGPTAPYTISLASFYNGTNNQRWTGPAAGADSISNSTPAPWTGAFNYGFNGTTWDRLYVLGTQADAQASSTNGLVTSSFLYGYNGTTFDMLRVGASNELQVTDVATRPGEDAANDWRKIKKEQTAVYTPAATTGTAVTAGTSPVIVLAATEVMSDVNFCVYLKNTDGADAFTDASIETSPNNSDWTGDLGWTACDTLAAGATCVYCVNGNSYRYIRVRVSSAADLTVSSWYVSNKN